LLEEKLAELNAELRDTDRFDPSPGHLKYIAWLRAKHETCLDSLEIWKCIRKVYPTYDR
jgi:hypothetical protein